MPCEAPPKVAKIETGKLVSNFPPSTDLQNSSQETQQAMQTKLPENVQEAIVQEYLPGLANSVSVLAQSLDLTGQNPLLRIKIIEAVVSTFLNLEGGNNSETNSQTSHFDEIIAANSEDKYLEVRIQLLKLKINKTKKEIDQYYDSSNLTELLITNLKDKLLADFAKNENSGIEKSEKLSLLFALLLEKCEESGLLDLKTNLKMYFLSLQNSVQNLNLIEDLQVKIVAELKLLLEKDRYFIAKSISITAVLVFQLLSNGGTLSSAGRNLNFGLSDIFLKALRDYQTNKQQEITLNSEK